MENYRPIRFFCEGCGKEIWQEMDYFSHPYDTLENFLHPKCASCILEEAKKRGEVK